MCTSIRVPVCEFICVCEYVCVHMMYDRHDTCERCFVVNGSLSLQKMLAVVMEVSYCDEDPSKFISY